MDRGAWWTTVHGVARVGHDLVTKPPPPPPLKTYLLLAIYFIFILDYGNDIRQKPNLSDFLFEFKMDCKAAETTRNINNTFDPGTANKRTVQ